MNLLTQEEFAKRLHISVRTVYQRRMAGEIAYVPGRPVMIPESELGKFVRPSKTSKVLPRRRGKYASLLTALGEHLSEAQIRRAVPVNLVRLLTEKRWNQSDLARAAGIGRDLVSRYVRGEQVPTPLTAHLMADVLGVNVKDLFVQAPDRTPVVPPGPRGPRARTLPVEVVAGIYRALGSAPPEVTTSVFRLLAPHLPEACK